MSDQDPVYAPPPDYSPSPAPSNYGPDAFGSPSQEQALSQPAPAAPAGKKKTALIIGIVVGLLVLCCCIGAGGLALFVVNSDTSTDSGVDTEVIDISESEDPRIQEWLGWNPEVAADILPAIPADKEDLVLEGLSIVAPEFAYDEAVWWQGGYDSDQDWYYPDSFYVRATHPSSDAVTAVVSFLIEGDEMAPLDIDYTPNEGATTFAVDGGARVLEYEPIWGSLGFSLDGEDDIALWQVLGDDWPDAVVLDKHESDLGAGYADVDLSTWSVFVYDAAIPYVRATYEDVDGEWVLYSWEYNYPDESEDNSI